jgi:hypothetical protein
MAGDVINLRFAVPPPVELRAVDHYRARAAYCMELAECATEPAAQAAFLLVADCFDQIAEEAEGLCGSGLLN